MLGRRGVVPLILALALTGTSALTVAGSGASSAAPKVLDPIPTPTGPPGTRTAKSLVIGLDGAMLDRILGAGTPNLHRLVEVGVSSLSYRYGPARGKNLSPEPVTTSGPGWSTLLTGVWPDQHGVLDNSFVGKRFDVYPDYLTRAERLDPTVSTFAIADWDPLATSDLNGPVISEGIDVRVGFHAADDAFTNVQDDARTADVAARYLREGDPDLSFVYFGSTDEAGHEHGNASPQYAASLERDDAWIGQLLSAVYARPTYAAEDWQIIVTNDHGHTKPGGHGGNTLAERQQWVVAAGGGIPAGPRRDDLKVTDVAATVLDHAGLPLDPALDGLPIRLVGPDAFDAVRPLLRPRVRDRAIPAGRLGFTHTPPPGWSIDNSRMARGGMPEWRGWTFTTDPFWTGAQPGQGREDFVRGRGVIAVADSDEFADRRSRGTFDSTLVSPSYDVSSAGAAVLGFQTFYQQLKPQRGRVQVRFDGGPPVKVVTYRHNTSGLQRFVLPVPGGARTMQVRFRYTGSDSWYWALDQVTVGRA